MSKLAQDTGVKPQGRSRFQYGDDPNFEAWIVDPAWPVRSKRVMFPTARVGDDGTVKPVSWTAEGLITYLQPTLRDWRAVYGGTYQLELRKPERLPVMFDRQPGAAAKTRAMMGDVFKKIADRASPRPVPKATPQVETPAVELTYRCSKHHVFPASLVDRRRCSIGCCPNCETVNADLQVVREPPPVVHKATTTGSSCARAQSDPPRKTLPEMMAEPESAADLPPVVERDGKWVGRPLDLDPDSYCNGKAEA